MTARASEPVQAHPIEWTDGEVSRLWDYYARTPPYSNLYFAKRFGPVLLADSRAPLRMPLEVLDFGCGPGFMWDHLRELHSAWNYTALDFSAASVADLSKRASGTDRFRGAIHVTGLPVPLPGKQFDVVLLIEVVEHLKDAYLQSTLEECARLLKPGGVLVISTPNEEDLEASKLFCPECGSVFHMWQHVRNWSIGTLRACVESAGFRLAHYRTTDYLAREATFGSFLLAVTRAVSRLAGRPRPDPHLLAVFQKT